MAKGDKRGLASADEETKHRVAREGGKASRKENDESKSSETGENMREEDQGSMDEEYFSQIKGLGNRDTSEDLTGMSEMDEDEDNK